MEKKKWKTLSIPIITLLVSTGCSMVSPFWQVKITTMHDGTKIYYKNIMRGTEPDIAVGNLCPEGYSILDISDAKPRAGFVDGTYRTIKFLCKGNYPTHVLSGVSMIPNPLIEPNIQKKSDKDIAPSPEKKSTFKSTW